MEGYGVRVSYLYTDNPISPPFRVRFLRRFRQLILLVRSFLPIPSLYLHVPFPLR